MTIEIEYDRIETLFYLKTVDALDDLDLTSIKIEDKIINSISISILSSNFTIHLNNYFSEIFKKMKNEENDSETELGLQPGEKFTLYAGAKGYYKFTSLADFKITNTGLTSGKIMLLLNEVK